MMRWEGGSAVTIPGEWYAAMNLLMDLCCLAAAQRLSSARARPGRMLFSAALGTGLSMLALACWGARAGVYAALPLAMLMALTAFGFRGCPRGAAGLMLFSLLAAGLASYLGRLGLSRWASALCCLPAVAYAGRLLLRALSLAGERRELRLLFAGGGVTLDGLVDTGNLLRDPITSLPVVVAAAGAFRPHLPAAAARGDLSALPRGFRLIRVRTAAGSQLLMCFRPRALYIRSGAVWQAAQAVVAVSPSLKGSRALLPPTL